MSTPEASQAFNYGDRVEVYYGRREWAGLTQVFTPGWIEAQVDSGTPEGDITVRLVTEPGVFRFPFSSVRPLPVNKFGAGDEVKVVNSTCVGKVLDTFFDQDDNHVVAVEWQEDCSYCLRIHGSYVPYDRLEPTTPPVEKPEMGS